MTSTLKGAKKLSLSSQPSSYQRLAVTALIKTGDLEKAHKILLQVQDAPLWMWLGKAYADHEQLVAASEAYAEAVKLDSQNKNAVEAQISLFHKIAIQYAKQKDWNTAGKYLQAAVDFDPGNNTFRELRDVVEILGLTAGLNFNQIDSGIPVLEKIQAKDISRADIAHQLAIFYHRRAITEDDVSANKNGANWEMAFGNWALTLNDMAYLQRWMQSRQKAYEHDLSESDLRKICQQNVPEIIKKIHGQYISSYGKSDQLDGVTYHKQLVARLNLEFVSAHSLAETIDFIKTAKRQTKIKIACGPIMWEHFHIQNDVEDIAHSALAIDPKFSPARKVLDALQPTEIIRSYLSEGLIDEPIAMLENELTKAPKNQLARELLQKAYLEKIKTMVNEPSANIQKIFIAAKKFNLNTSDMEVEYAQQVLVKAGQAYDVDQLEDADKILRDGLKIASSNQTLKDKLADVANRRVKLMVEGAMEKDPGNVVQYIERAKAILMDADKIVGPNHPALMQHLNSLQEIAAQVQVSSGIERANKAIANFKPGSNYDATMSEIDQALSALQIGLRAAPNNAHIRQQIDELNKVKTGMAGAEAGYHNEQGVQYLNTAVSYFQSGNRSSGITYLRYARDALEKAVRLQPYNTTMQENLKVVKNFMAQAGVY